MRGYGPLSVIAAVICIVSVALCVVQFLRFDESLSVMERISQDRAILMFDPSLHQKASGQASSSNTSFASAYLLSFLAAIATFVLRKSPHRGTQWAFIVPFLVIIWGSPVLLAALPENNSATIKTTLRSFPDQRIIGEWKAVPLVVLMGVLKKKAPPDSGNAWPTMEAATKLLLVAEEQYNGLFVRIESDKITIPNGAGKISFISDSVSPIMFDYGKGGLFFGVDISGAGSVYVVDLSSAEKPKSNPETRLILYRPGDPESIIRAIIHLYRTREDSEFPWVKPR